MVGTIVGIKRGIPDHMIRSLMHFNHLQQNTTDAGLTEGSAAISVTCGETYSVKKYGVHLARMLLDNRPRENLVIVHNDDEYLLSEGCLDEGLPQEIHADSSLTQN